MKFENLNAAEITPEGKHWYVSFVLDSRPSITKYSRRFSLFQLTSEPPHVVWCALARMQAEMMHFD